MAVGKKKPKVEGKLSADQKDDDSKGEAGKPKLALVDAAGVLQEQMEEIGEEGIVNFAEFTDCDAYEKATSLYDKIQKCYDNQNERDDNIGEFWNIYNATPDENQQYTGNSQCYLPAVRNAINARSKRTLAQLFPVNFKHVEAVGPSGANATEVLALMEHYIRAAKVKNAVRADLIAGDVTGQWNLYIDWTKHTRTIKQILKRPPIKTNKEENVQIIDVGEDDVEEIEEKEIIVEGPEVVPFAAEDLAVYPPTCDDIQRATAVSLKLRMSKEKVRQMCDEGVFLLDDDEIDDLFRLGNNPAKDRKNPAKARTSDAGVKTQGTYKYLMVYAVYTDLELPDDDGKEKKKGDRSKRKEAVVIYYYGENQIAGIIKSPFWSGKRPILSASVEEITGSFFGTSKIDPVKYLQWNLNDFWNMGMDSAQYSMLPIVMTDPLKSPQYQSMVMGLAAIWLVDPNSTKFQEFPQLWKDAMGVCQNIKTEINESMDVNDAMLGKMPQGRKNNQMVGNMQQEAQINIIDHAKRYEEMILNPMAEMFFELDQQFRTDVISVQTRGDIGVKAMIAEVEPQSFDVKWFFRWCGTTYQMNVQRIQQMTSTMNVIRGIPPQQLNGRRFDATPILEFMVEQTFGPELGARIFIDERNMYSVPPDIENDWLLNGLPADVHEGDNHQEHIESHNSAAKETGDPTGAYRSHIIMHMKKLQEMQQKMIGQMQQGQQQPGAGGGMPGVPGGGQPGVAGTPRPGGQVGQPRPQGPPGMIHADAMPGAPGRG
jgi:hypothetical protein